MHVGVVKEIKAQEERVGLTPAGLSTSCAAAAPFWSRRAPASAPASPTTSTSRPTARSLRRCSAVSTNLAQARKAS
jgi:hypothetical protein